MAKNLVVGILRETKENEFRAPLLPRDVNWLIKQGIKVEVERSSNRVYKDQEYRKKGARIVDRFKNATLLVGIKEPQPQDLYSNRIYMIFSHTTKGQSQNMPLLKSCLKKNITLIDYEKIVDSRGKRLVYFGRFAGICGAIDSLHFLGHKLAWKGIDNPFPVHHAHQYGSLNAVKRDLIKIGENIRDKGISGEISPFIIGITGRGSVSRGVQEILELLNPVEIHPKNIFEFVQCQGKRRKRVYKIVFFREEKLRSKKNRGFYFEEYLENPQDFESNLDRYMPYLNLLIHTSYWDPKYPRMVTKKAINRLMDKKPFRLEFIGDLSCDINGSIELTYKVGSFDNPTFTYTKSRKFIDGYKSDGVTILAVDNLPSQLPRDASGEFSQQIKEYVYQIAVHGFTDATNHMVIPQEIRKAVITQSKKLTPKYRYLRSYF